MDEMRDFAERYTAAWNSQDPTQVADFFTEEGVLTINGGIPHEGRDAIAEVVAGFMTAFPDLVIYFDSLEEDGERFNYHWTFIGTNTGDGGTGQEVDFSGYEAWLMGDDGLVADSLGNFDAEEYARQLEHGVGEDDTA